MADALFKSDVDVPAGADRDTSLASFGGLGAGALGATGGAACGLGGGARNTTSS